MSVACKIPDPLRWRPDLRPGRILVPGLCVAALLWLAVQHPVSGEVATAPSFSGPPSNTVPSTPTPAQGTSNAPTPNLLSNAQPATVTAAEPPNLVGLDTTNSPAPPLVWPPKRPEIAIAAETADRLKQLQGQLELARHLRLTRQTAQATPLLVELLAEDVPEEIQRSALLELALVAQDENDLPRAQQVYAQFVQKWPADPRVPEVLLRQGLLFRRMGLNNLALAKFYSVMTAALVLKTDYFEYYQRLVLQAQIEIAETHYLSGRFAEAAEFYQRLLRQNNPFLNRALVQYRLIRSLAAVGRHDEAASQAYDFLDRFPDAPEQPEVRFLLATSLKQLGRNSEALQQVLKLLTEQRARTADRPEVWAYWQRRTGNEIANQLYREGDYTRALDIYLTLAQLDSSPAWQLPVLYQVGMTYERLQQPELAAQTYQRILDRVGELGTNATPGLQALIQMARWRMDFVKWQTRAELALRRLAPPVQASTTPLESAIPSTP
ncbi:tetratricopeptide repeat protein [Limisphaera ngatamarikiensis]|uniref:Tetratricopeptide repeat protein n=1 Tax=Limisphaera ngatamarikiensis TaxID=1324935 RepID=A0A6M1REY1_9BACT|nr:tetratricopeptide repeat protein [Limisphaera ngatamarikiensis]